MMDNLVDGTLFGLIDNAVLILGAYTGLEQEFNFTTGEK